MIPIAVNIMATSVDKPNEKLRKVIYIYSVETFYLIFIDQYAYKELKKVFNNQIVIHIKQVSILKII